jgi:tetratricopeptide (TPR) repeat protein
MGHTRKNFRQFAIVLFLTVLVGGLGCQQKIVTTDMGMPVDPLTNVMNADLERNAEVQLVEQMGRYRASYQENLELMLEFYNRQGNQLKAKWVTEELENLRLGPRYSYLVVAEVAGPDLRASRMIIEADMLYDEGMSLMKSGRGTIGKFMVDKKKMYSAIEKFNELITLYPDSDKIDDAAFQVGYIYNHYLNEKTTALMYYQRVWQWDPQTLLPARFAVAKIYDEYFHNLTKAVEYYEKAINLESSYTKNVVYAQNRIAKINKELARE